MILEVTSKQFRDKQKTFFDMADAGKHIIIKRGRKRAYSLIPIDNDDDDIYFTPEMIEKINHSLHQAEEGKITRVSGIEELDKFLESL